MYAYVFAKGATKDSLTKLQDLRGSHGIRFVTSLSGPYDALVALEAADLKELESTVQGPIRGTGVAESETVMVVWPPLPPPPMPKWLEALPVEAFVATHVEQGRAMDVVNAAQEIRGFMGAAIVAGSFDVLLEFGGQTFEEVADILLSSLHRVEGIESTASYFAAFDSGAAQT